ncbi:hypothetical protein ACF0H5_021872 [Mactra antiquata]
MNLLTYCIGVTLLLTSLCYHVQVVQAKGMSGFSAQHSKRSNGEIRFKDQASVTLDDGQSEKFVTLSRVNADRTKYPNQAFYTDDKRKIHCTEDCSDEEFCSKRCLDTADDGSYFYKEDDFLFIPGKDGHLKALEPNFENLPKSQKTSDPYQMYTKQEPLTSDANKKRSTTPNVPGANVGTIEVLYYVDQAFVSAFWSFGGSNVAQTKLEVQKFVQLVTNEVSLIYKSLSGYSLQTSLNGVTRPLDITVHNAGVVFPPDNGVVFSEASWAQNSMSGNVYMVTTTAVYYYQPWYWIGTNYYAYAGQSYPQYSGALTAFSSYLGTLSNTGTYDVAQYLTGANIIFRDVEQIWVWNRSFYVWEYWYDIITDSSSVIGVAWMNTLCRNFPAGSDVLASGMSELFLRQIDSLLAHEIGHNLSISQTEPSCLYGTPPTASDFQTAFCNGLTGQYTFDQQCRLRFRQPNFTACNTTTNGYVNNDGCNKPLQCGNGCTNTNTNFVMSDVFHGSKCRNPDNTEGNMICYNRACVAPSALCSAQG